MLALVVHLIALAVLFLLLRAQFVAAAQVIVYAGAVMVLYVFVVAYVGGGDEPAPLWRASARQRALAIVFGVAAVRRAVDRDARHRPEGARHATGAPSRVGFGSPGADRRRCC